MRVLAACLGLLACSAAAQTPGQPLPPWQEGNFDIHQINTGRGDTALLVFPDGTAMLVDAGDGGWGAPPRGVDPKPDGSRKAGEWIARYAKRVLGNGAKIDYAYLTHFHSDHMSGYPELVKHIPVGTFLDRGWPSYDYPAPVTGGGAEEYIAAVRAQVSAGKAKAERFQPGRNDQVVLLHNAKKYPNFEARNIAANGEVWTGVATNTRHHFPANYKELPQKHWPTENQCSMAIRISYGAFDYYTGGDMPGVLQPGWPVWMDVETPVAKAVGPVEVVVPNHHGNRDSTNAFFVSTLRPRLWILPVWSSDHPGNDVLVRMLSTELYEGQRDVFATNMPVANKQVIGPLLDELLSDQGHVVIRVAPGGASFQAIVLEDSDESMRVKAAFGPYEAR